VNLDRVDRQCAAVDPPPGFGALVLVVVAQVPHHVGDAAVLDGPVVRDAGDSAEGVIMMRPFGIHLADDRVLGAFQPGDGRQGRPYPVVPVMVPHRLEHPRRIGQPQLRGVGEQGDHVVEPAVVDGRGVEVDEVGDGEPVGHVERHGRSSSLRAQSDSS
jgi:hypothetical protein